MTADNRRPAAAARSWLSGSALRSPVAAWCRTSG